MAQTIPATKAVVMIKARMISPHLTIGFAALCKASAPLASSIRASMGALPPENANGRVHGLIAGWSHAGDKPCAQL